MKDFTHHHVRVVKVDESQGLVFGWAIVCKEGGKEYFDLQDDHIPEELMLSAATDFMEKSRAAGEMHARLNAGDIVHSMPLTEEVAKAFDLKSKRTGWMIAAKPDKAMLAKFKSGELTGFSIGGAGEAKEVN